MSPNNVINLLILQKSHPNEMLAGLKYFEHPLKSKNGEKLKDACDWGDVDRSAMARCLMPILRAVRDQLKDEPRLLRLKSPVYILGKH